jgi:hypothetical protein
MSNEQEHLKKVHDKDADNYASSSVFDDLAGLRKAQKITVVRKTVLINVKVDKPANNVHFRAHPEWYLDDCSVVQDRNAGTFYYVHPIMRSHPKLAPRLRYVTLGVIYLWPSGALQIWPVPKLEGTGASSLEIRAQGLRAIAWVALRTGTLGSNCLGRRPVGLHRRNC